MSQSTERPRPPRLTVRVGVTGHRPDSLKQADKAKLLESIRAVLLEIAEATRRIQSEAGGLYGPEKPLLRLISPLAEGADRLVAEEALNLKGVLSGQGVDGFELQCPLPVTAGEYIKRFKDPASALECERLLGAAKAVLALDYGHEDEESTGVYLALGEAVLHHCDVLIAVWDGEEAKGEGGTGQIVSKALAMSLPVVWISSRPDHPAYLYEPKSEVRGDLALLGDCLRHTFLLGSDSTDGDNPASSEANRARRFFKERRYALASEVVFKLFRRFWAGEPPPRRASADPVEPPVSAWKRFLGLYPDLNVRHESGEGSFEWPDFLAKFYAGAYRSSFVLTSILSAVAVLAAFVGLYTHKQLWFKAELILLLAIVAIVWIGRRQFWHERWMDYRLLAESLRQLNYLDLIGVSRHVLAHLEDVGRPSKGWLGWYLRAHVRELGMVNAVLDVAYLECCKQIMKEAIQSQVQYHSVTYTSFRELHHRPHLVTQVPFFIAAGACGVHLLIERPAPSLNMFLGFCALVLPLFGAALGSILHYGDFERIAILSRALKATLQRLADDLEAANLSSPEMARIAERLSSALFSELMIWQILFASKKLDMPG